MIENPFGVDSLKLFGDYMKVTGVPTLKDKSTGDPKLIGKKLGVINGSAWTTLWCSYFGQMFVPGAKIINVGNEAVQLNFMRAHHNGEPCPPQINIDLFCQYAKHLYDLVKVDAILISCSTMNRAFDDVKNFMKPYNIPIIQIDEAMMETAVNSNGKILVIATHGPTVKSTQNLLQETADRLNKKISFVGATHEECFEALGAGDIKRHNDVIADAIRNAQKKEKIDIVVLAQLSMTVFVLSYPDPIKEFGIPVLTSGESGFKRAAEILKNL